MDAITLIGKIVKFPIVTLHGTGKAAGTAVRVMPDGMLEIRAQLGGYYLIALDKLIP